jgi:F-type H+-transporting ATPase subunit gamma
MPQPEGEEEKMATIEDLRETISNTEDLHSVVRTMKAMAAVRIRQYQEAVASLEDYNHTVRLGLQILLRQRYFAGHPLVPPGESPPTPISQGIGAIIIGSDQGLCGQFNQQVANHATSALGKQECFVASVGERVVPLLNNQNIPIQAQFSLPTSATGITVVVQEILLTIEQWRTQQQMKQILLFYNQFQGGSSYQPRTLKLLPLDRDWLRDLQQKEWETNMLPTFTMDWETLFSRLIREYLFVSLYRAFANSLASENASRLAAMQSAQRNIEDHLSELQAQYRRQRQSVITSELLDVVAGFEALTGK